LKKLSKISIEEVTVVALGCNLPGPYGSCRALLDAAIARLPDFGLVVVERSAWWRSAAWPKATDPDYLNGVALVETRLSAPAVMVVLRRIEATFGRRRGELNAPRTLDLDLIAHGRTVINQPGLTLPHPRAAERLFVMGPLAQIAPRWEHPLTGQTARALTASASIGLDAAPLAAR
jgi:2-amino-4-hydroxy-6-hydroxymethyldihydropteridine diphosphokinase